MASADAVLPPRAYAVLGSPHRRNVVAHECTRSHENVSVEPDAPQDHQPSGGTTGPHPPTAEGKERVAPDHRLFGSLRTKVRQIVRAMMAPCNLLPALPVYVDVTWSSAAQMLRTAVSAVAAEAVAAIRRGPQGKLQKMRKLHKALTDVWLLPVQQGADGAIRHLDKSLPGAFRSELMLLHQFCQAGNVRYRSCGRESPILHADGSVGCRGKQSVGDSSLRSESLGRQQEHVAPDLAAPWQPLKLRDGSVAAPPVSLLAAYAAGPSMRCQNHDSARKRTARLPAPSCVVGLCVRSLLDLYIQSVRSLRPSLLPKGSVALVSAVNIPMMFRVLEGHGLVVHPLDLHHETLMPTEESLRSAVKLWGPAIKLVLCPHLFGGLNDLQPLVDFCAKHKALLIEDCAESFSGHLYRGHPGADISLFSFGMIKTCTAGGGAIATVRSPFVARRMNSLQALYPYSRYRTFFKKLCILMAACFVQHELTMKSILKICQIGGWEVGTFLQSFVRGFPPGYNIFELLRVQPNAALLSVLLSRLKSWNNNEFLYQQARIIAFSKRVLEIGLQVPGYAAGLKTFWLFPVVVPEPINVKDFAAALRENGLYAANDTTTLVCHKAGPELLERVNAPLQALKMMSRILYLPVNRVSSQQQLKQLELGLAKCLDMLSPSMVPPTQRQDAPKLV